MSGLRRKFPHVTDDGENVFIEKYVDFPSPEDVFEEGDVLVMVGSERAITEVERFVEREV